MMTSTMASAKAPKTADAEIATSVRRRRPATSLMSRNGESARLARRLRARPPDASPIELVAGSLFEGIGERSVDRPATALGHELGPSARPIHTTGIYIHPDVWDGNREPLRIEAAGAKNSAAAG
jgi:hypothetical protein